MRIFSQNQVSRRKEKEKWYLPKRNDFPVRIAPATDMIEAGRSATSDPQNIWRTLSRCSSSLPSSKPVFRIRIRVAKKSARINFYVLLKEIQFNNFARGVPGGEGAIFIFLYYYRDRTFKHKSISSYLSKIFFFKSIYLLKHP